MPELRPSTFTRQVDKLAGERGYQKLWECPSASAGRAGIQAWAIIEVSFDPQLRQCVPFLRRLFTRKTGEVRERYGASVEWRKVGVPAGGPLDMAAMRRCAEMAVAALPLLLTDGDTELAETARRIFIPKDVIA